MSKQKVLVLGSTGMIGHRVFFELDSSGDYLLYDFSYRKKLREESLIFDARDEKFFLTKIKNIKPDIVINCIGILIDGSKKDPENAIFLNAYLPHKLASLAKKMNSKLIHISTDCVFSGEKTTPYMEDDFKDGSSIYGKSKGLGEVNYDNHLTLRTSVIGPELKTDGEELFHWFMSQSDDISGYTKSIWSGVTTIELARAVNKSIKKDISGIHHVTNNKSISKYDLLKIIRKIFSRKINILPEDGVISDKSFIDTRNLLDKEIPSYEVMISELYEIMKKNKSLYSQYFYEKS